MLPISISQIKHLNLKNLFKIIFWTIIRFIQINNKNNYQFIYILGPSGVNNHGIYIPESVLITKNINTQTIILITKFNLLEIVKKIRHFKRFRIVDKNFFLTSEASTNMRLWYCDFTSGKDKVLYKEISEINLARLISTNINKPIAVLGTGPSYNSAKDYFIKKEIKIITCNSAVYDSDLWKINNVSLCFADPVFHFGQSEEAMKFKNEVIKKFNEKPFYIILPIEGFPIVKNNWGIDEGYLIGLQKGSQTQLNGQFGETIKLKRTSNILTEFMIPLSTMTSKNIFLGGFDGRETQEKNFWQYANNTNQDLDPHVESHPSFFNDRDMLKYYENHIKILENQISGLEKKGYVFNNITESNIEFLNKRIYEK